jgi:plastocyanin
MTRKELRMYRSVALVLLLAFVAACGQAAPATPEPTDTPAAPSPVETPAPPTATPAAPTPEPATPTPEPAATPTEAPAATPTQAPAGDRANVRIVDFGFNPREVHVVAGGTVAWTHQGELPHTVTFEDGTDSGALGPGGEYERTFEEAGTYAYACRIHPTMTGTVTVGD